MFDTLKKIFNDFFFFTVFIREWLLHSSLHRCSIEAGMDYNNTSIDWANFMRDLCHKFVHDLTVYYGGEEIFRGEVEIDEGLFGRKCKFHCGDPRGQRIWILGIDPPSNLISLDARDEATLIPLIARHVEKGSSIYTDGWHAYQSLNDRGNDHYMVEHKYTFVQQYRNREYRPGVEDHAHY